MAGIEAQGGRVAAPHETLPTRAPAPRAFRAALARLTPASTPVMAPGATAGGRAGPAPPGGALALRRKDADAALATLGRRREEAEKEPERTCASPCVTQGLAAWEARSGPPPVALASAAALDRAVLEVVRARGRTAVALEVAGGVRLRLAPAPGGVELTMEAPRGLAAAARAELPALVQALRARGVGVAGAAVREGSRPGASAPAHALTPRQGSATTAPGQAPAGTVAKW